MLEVDNFLFRVRALGLCVPGLRKTPHTETGVERLATIFSLNSGSLLNSLCVFRCYSRQIPMALLDLSLDGGLYRM